MIPFVEFPKMPRLNRECTIVEKIDGTNAQIHIVDKSFPNTANRLLGQDVAIQRWGPTLVSRLWGRECVWQNDSLAILAGSRTRWISPGKDHYRFAGWVQRNAEELSKLGPGRHYGEWWGQGIQRGYGLSEKRFSLFNVDRFSVLPRCHENDRDPSAAVPGVVDSVTGETINCCHVVPTLYTGPFRTSAVEAILALLKETSYAAPGFKDPEGIIIWHAAAEHGFKVTLKDDEQPKSLAPK